MIGWALTTRIGYKTYGESTRGRYTVLVKHLRRISCGLFVKAMPEKRLFSHFSMQVKAAAYDWLDIHNAKHVPHV